MLAPILPAVNTPIAVRTTLNKFFIGAPSPVPLLYNNR